MRELVAAAGLLLVQQPASTPVPQPPLEYQSLAPLTVTLTLGDAEWVNTECASRLRRQPSEGMVFEACAGIGRNWIVMRHGALYPGGQGDVLAHETGHVRGWVHG